MSLIPLRSMAITGLTTINSGGGDYVSLTSGFTPLPGNTWINDFKRGLPYPRILVPSSPDSDYAPIKGDTGVVENYFCSSSSCAVSDINTKGINYIYKFYDGGGQGQHVFTTSQMNGSSNDTINVGDSNYYYGINSDSKVVRIIPITLYFPSGGSATTTTPSITDGDTLTLSWVCKIGNNAINATGNNSITITGDTATIDCSITLPTDWTLNNPSAGTAIFNSKSYTSTKNVPNLEVTFGITNLFGQPLNLTVNKMDKLSITNSAVATPLNLTTSQFSATLTFHQYGAALTCPINTTTYKSPPTGPDGNTCTCKDNSGSGKVAWDPAHASCSCNDSLNNHYYSIPTSNFYGCGPTCGGGSTGKVTSVSGQNLISCQCDTGSWNGTKCVTTGGGTTLKGFGGTCTVSSQCDSSLYLTCSSAGKCACESGYSASGTTCVATGSGGGTTLKGFGGTCTADSDCNASLNLSCDDTSGKCECTDGYYVENGLCKVDPANECIKNGGTLNLDGSCISSEESACEQKNWTWNTTTSTCTDPNAAATVSSGGCSISDTETPQVLLQLIPYLVLLGGLRLRRLGRKK